MMFRRMGICLLLTAILLAGCGKTPGNTEERLEATVYVQIQRALTEMKNYKSSATIEYISNKGTNQYEILQASRATGEYRVEVTGPENVAGNITVFDGATIYQFNPRVAGRVSVGVKENQERSEIFVTSFVRNYLRSQEVSVSAGSFGESRSTALEAIVPGDHPYLSTEKLWVDNETLKPVKLAIYDPEGSERIIVTFNTFEYNVELDDSLFSYK
jgi:outer membrane lipoprotein-sorting protein